MTKRLVRPRALVYGSRFRTWSRANRTTAVSTPTKATAKIRKLRSFLVSTSFMRVARIHVLIGFKAAGFQPLVEQAARVRERALPLLKRKYFHLNAPILFIVFSIARICIARQRIIPTIADDFKFVGVQFIFFHDSLADRIVPIIGELAEQI